MSIMTPAQFKVLCIEDEPDIRHDIVDELRDHGFQVDQAASAEEALPLIGAGPPDLILCDVQMPGMSGLELLVELRGRRDATASIPFVFLTAFGDREAMINGRKAGADDYLVKPVDYDLLIAAVESHLHNAARRAEVAAGAAAFTASSIGERRDEMADLIADLQQRPAGTMVAVAKIDNFAEVSRRLDEFMPGYSLRLSHRLAAWVGVHAYWINAHTLAVLSDSEERAISAVNRMMHLDLRGARGHASEKIPVKCSLVIGRTSSAETPPALIERLMASARLLQRDGGAKMVDADSPEIKALELANSIRGEVVEAITRGQLHVCFQPQVRARERVPVSAEVLVRWESPTLGQLSPMTFIPVVEKAGLLPHVTDWVLREAARSQLHLTRLGLPARLAINVGALEFNHHLPQRIIDIFAACGADPGLVEIEITETSLLADPEEANAVVSALHAHGITVALDDFGTGFASLSYLQTCAVDVIKIDRSFVADVTNPETGQKIVLGIMQLAQMLGVETVAEGVETAGQADWLTAHDCTTLQGYYLARPTSLAGYCELLQSWQRQDAASRMPE